MKSPVPGTTEHRRSPGAFGPAGRRFCSLPAGQVFLVLVLCLVPVLVFLPAVSAADGVPLAGNVTAAGTPSSAPVQNGSVILNETAAGIPAQAAPAETISPDATATPAANVSPTEVSPQEEIDAMMERGEICYQKENYNCTWESFDTAYLLLPNSTDILWIYSYYLAKSGDYDKALDKIDRALAIAPDNGELWYQKGQILNKAGKFIESSAALDKAAAIDPDMKAPITQHFPFNLGARYLTFIVIGVGFMGLCVYIYFREFRQ